MYPTNCLKLNEIIFENFALITAAELNRIEMPHFPNRSVDFSQITRVNTNSNKQFLQVNRRM